MRFSESWLREWVSPSISTEELIEQLTMAGLEVDGHEPAAQAFSGVVVGEVVSVEAHPDADKLRVCMVSDGAETVQVVCGAPNVVKGLRVPFAKVGAVLGEDFKIKKAKLRGLESNGMLCGADELGLGETSEGLMELEQDAPVGGDLRSYLDLDDCLIEVDLTPNRGDCLSIAGLAREVGVLNRADVSVPEGTAVSSTIEDQRTVELKAPNDCPHYLGRVIKGINPSAVTPLWMQEKLRRANINSIAPVVDVTNYVLMELGHPMHAFDLEKLSGGIQVRKATSKEKLILLDEKEVELRDDTLVIADETKVLAIAGVMGGFESGVRSETQDIFLESAFFEPLCIAGKARSYGLQTDAAHRYERGVDYALASKAMERATALLLDIVGGKPGPVTEAISEMPVNKTVSLRIERIKKVLGIEFKEEDIEEILGRLGLVLLNKESRKWEFEVPSWRFDLALEVDLIEELARVYGYDKLPSTRPNNPVSLRSVKEKQLSLQSMRSLLCGLGYQEVITYSFVEETMEVDFGEAVKPVHLANPLSQELSVMRTSLWPGLIKTLKHNQNRQQQRVRIFETGLTFLPESDGNICQNRKVAGLFWGSKVPEQWSEKKKLIDFYDIKGDLEAVLSLTLDEQSFSFEVAERSGLQIGQTAKVLRNGDLAGWVGAIDPIAQQKLDVPGKVYLFELDVETLKGAALPVAEQLSRFPSVRRDLALIVDKNQGISEILGDLEEVAGSILVNTVVFDVFEGDNIGKNKKSLAIGLTFQHPSRTLNDKEINSIIDSGIKVLQDKFNVELRM